MNTKTQQISDLIKPEVEALGFELWGCELQTSDKGSLLRIYIDAENGVQIDDCAKVSRQISALFDVEDPISGNYRLEVSSPGVERLLFTLEHYKLYLGEVIKVQLLEAVNGKRKQQGYLITVDDDTVTLNVDGEECVIPFHVIRKANLALVL